MRVGSAIYCTSQGLGILARDFYDHGVLTDVILVRHSSRPNNFDWYEPGTPVIDARRWEKERPVLEELVAKVDVMLFMECPFHWELIPYCRERGVKTILQTMYECEPRNLPYQPDYFLCPSKLDLRYYPEQSIFIPVPVPDYIRWKQRDRACVFIHNSGYGGLLNRNGTGELLDAMRYVRSPLQLIIRTQRPLPWGIPNNDERVTVVEGTLPQEQLWDEGDVFIFPEKFNGLSLPLQEARASGMLVMAADRFPMNDWLPREPLLPTIGSRKTCISGRCNDIEESVLEPQQIGKKMDEYYCRNIHDYSLSGRQWARDNSWTVLKPRYMEFLESVISTRTGV